MKRLLAPLFVAILSLLCLPALSTPVVATGFAAGLSTVGYQVLTLSGTTVTVATVRTTTGVSAGIQPTSYLANPTLPDNCFVILDDGAGTYAVQEFGTCRAVAGFASGLSTVGYTPISSTGTAGARTTTGVVELISGTGIYGVSAITGSGATWDDGQSSPTYATELFASSGTSPPLALTVPPLALTVTLNGSNQRLLTWTADPLATKYNIYRRVTGTSPTLLIGTVMAPTVTFTDTTAVPTIDYTYLPGAVH